MGMGVAAVVPLGATDFFAGDIRTPGEVDEFQIDIPDNGRLTVVVQTGSGACLDTRLSLLGPDGRLLIQSEGQSPSNHDDQIVQHLLAGTYFVQVQGLGNETGTYTLTTDFQPAVPPNEPLLVNFARDYPFSVTPPYHVAGDFNGDGYLDIATPNTWTNDVSILLGLGDGSFQTARNFAVGAGPFGMAAADFNGDGFLDLAAKNQYSNDVSVLLGTGDEQLFAPEVRSPGGTFAFSWGMAAGDLNSDDLPDLVIANLRTNDVSILLGKGDGTFEAEQTFAVGVGPNGVTTGDFNGDGHLDVATTNFNDDTLSLLLGLGDGTFQPERRIAEGPSPGNISAADFNADGRLDLAVNLGGADTVLVLLGEGDGTFPSQTRYAAGSIPYSVVPADFDGDRLIDLAVSNRESNDVSVLLGRGDGTFQDQERYRTGVQPWNVVAGDFNGDQHLDLATANARSHDVSILIGLGDGTFQQEPTDPRPGETNPSGMVARDFNHDGILDLAAVTYLGHDLLVFLGRGDGTFRERMRFDVGSTPVELVTEDFDHDGHHDLATINCDSGDLSVLLGRGDGTFADQVRYASSISGEWGIAADFNRDGSVDIVASGQFATGIAFVPGNGDGTFGERTFFALDEAPADGVAGDFNHDGFLDVATTNFFSTPDYTISVHLGRGDGTFDAPAHYAVGDFPLGIVTGDFNEDGHLDLVNTNFQSNPGTVSLLLGVGNGTFLPEVRLRTGLVPDFVITRDFDSDGHLDLVVSNAGSNNVSVLLGRGDGTFQDQVFYTVGDGPTPRRGLEAADFNGDGLLDLALPQVISSDVSVLLGGGDGTFAAARRFPVGLGPVAFVTGDLNSDARLDVVAVNPTNNQVEVSLGLGDATLQTPVRFDVGLSPVAIVRGDFNSDGRLDVAAANQGSNDVSVLLGLGNGSFRDEARFTVGANPVALVTDDFNKDGRLDLAVANAGSNKVSLLLGRGDGTFRAQLLVSAVGLPQALAAGDFNKDGRPDLAVAHYQSNDVSLLLGRGDGTFRAPVRLAVGSGPVSLLTGDFDGDGRLDLAAANYQSNDVSVLLRQPGTTFQGTFRSVVQFAVGTNPVSLTASDFNGDGRLDLATANSLSDDVSLLLGRGDGTFAAAPPLAVEDYPAAVAGADFNSDGRPDLVVAAQLSPEISIRPGLGDATFLEPGTLSNPLRATPLVLDWNGDGAADVAVVNGAGDILLRLGRAGNSGEFEAPVVLNQNGTPARDLALVNTPGGFLLAALGARDSSVSLYSSGPGGTILRKDGPEVPGVLPVRLVTGDLSGDGFDDLAVVAGGSAEVLVYLQGPAGLAATPGFRLAVGLIPSDVSLADVDGDQLLDIVATNQSSGDISVFRNDAATPFAFESRYRAGTGLYYLQAEGDALSVGSGERPARILAGNFDGDPLVELIVSNSGSNSFSVLHATSAAGLLNPRRFSAGLQPTIAVAGRFNADPFLDLAILNQGSDDLSVFLGDGTGSFTEQARFSAGNLPTGLSVHDVDGDGHADLLVGNQFGDLLILPGNGDGTFDPYQRVGRNIALAVADLNGDGQDDFVFANEALDRVSVEYGAAGRSVLQDRDDGLLAPGAVGTADLNRDGLTDLVVANSGANNVLVYLGIGNGQFSQGRSFFAGTNPAGLTIKDLNGDQLLDLVVANEGSNDVTVLLGRGKGTAWTLTDGPRLRAGVGPVSTTVDDVNGDGIPDLLVTNSQSNNVSLLRGLGAGFFNDLRPTVFGAGLGPRQSFVGQFDGLPGLDLLTINAGSNDVSFRSSFGAARRFGSGGETPVAGAAGDFNGDGLGDLLVANNGDGVVSLLVGDAAGLLRAGTFAHEELLHPASLALAIRDGRVDVFASGEGRESAVLLTSFGIPAPAPGGPPPSLSDFFLVNGPGFAVTLEVLIAAATVDNLAGERVDLDAARPDLTRLESLLSGDEAQDEPTTAPEDAAAAARLNLLMGVDEALRRMVGAGPDLDDYRAAAEIVLGTLANAFGPWLPLPGRLPIAPPPTPPEDLPSPEGQEPDEGPSPTSLQLFWPDEDLGAIIDEVAAALHQGPPSNEVSELDQPGSHSKEPGPDLLLVSVALVGVSYGAAAGRMRQEKKRRHLGHL